MVRSDSPLGPTIDELPGVKPASEPSERYDLYGVNLRRLDRLVGGLDAR
jgi:hypothetical protein